MSYMIFSSCVSLVEFLMTISSTDEVSKLSPIF